MSSQPESTENTTLIKGLTGQVAFQEVFDKQKAYFDSDVTKTPAQFWDRPHSVHTRKTVEVRHDFSFVGVEDDELVGIHVRDVEPPLGRVKALVIEADGCPRHGNIRDLFEKDRLSIVGGGIRRAGSLQAHYKDQKR